MVNFFFFVKNREYKSKIKKNTHKKKKTAENFRYNTAGLVQS